MIRDKIRQYIREALQGLSGDSARPDFVVSVPEIVEYGDYSTNVALVSGKLVGKKPLDFANELVSELLAINHSPFAHVDVAGPGFLNFTLSDAFVFGQLQEILKSPDQWGTSDTGKGKTVMVEYTDPIRLNNSILGTSCPTLLGSQLPVCMKRLG